MNNTKGKERRDNKSRRLCLLHKKDKEYLSKFAVVPHAGTWIEIGTGYHRDRNNCVVPHAGTWIEIRISKDLNENYKSFPTRERGLKCFSYVINIIITNVVPHAGTWIEISEAAKKSVMADPSFPTRERGLKCHNDSFQ